ncbi:hypothetical protein LPJ59_000232 [Coemansia sp. RSA 2399]|nr:hypothetical protein LPJ59_000232 [Coemansia sp. RSA 2399]KAJ1908281.1 hypothetical protein LPJ81_000192 [Coemansia sp. IMI 209127]
MHVNSLPPSVLRHILTHTAAPLHRWWKDWKHTLPLLHVSAQWRSIGKPLVYSHLFVYCIEAETNNDDDSDDEGDDVAIREIRTYGAVPQMMWRTNGPLIAAIGATDLVHDVRINLRGPGYMFPFLDGIIGMLVQISPGGAWPLVHTLSIHLASDYIEPSAPPRLQHHHHQQQYSGIADLAMETASSLADALAYAFPAAEKLRVGGCDASEAFCRFADRLSYHYAMQLRKLETRYPVSCMSPCFNPQLASLHLTVRPYIGQLVPHVAPRSLKYLCLDGISVNFRWQCFYENEGSVRDMCFAQLEHLAVHYNAIHNMEVDAVVTNDYSGRPDMRKREGGREAGMLPYCLDFPQLKTLTITRCPPTGGLLSCCTLPRDTLMSITLDGALEAVCKLAQFVGAVSRVGELSVSVRGFADKDASYLGLENRSDMEMDAMVSAVNRLYSEDDWHLDNGVLCLFDDIVLRPTHIAGIQSVNLKELTVDSPLSLSIFVKIIETQPQLTSMSCYNLQIAMAEPMDVFILENVIDKLDSDDGDIQVNEESSWTNGGQTLKSSRLERIVACNHINLFSHTAALSLACWLMVNIHSLKYILVSRLSLGQAARFVEKAKHVHPHLLDIAINTN